MGKSTKHFTAIMILIVMIFFHHLHVKMLYAYPPGWSDDILLTPEDSVHRIIPDIDVDIYNNVWVAWDSAMWVNGTGEILYSKRDSLGNALISETSVSNNASYSIIPHIVTDVSNSVHFVWRDESPQGFGIWYAKLANDGSTIVSSQLAVSGAGGLGMDLGIVLNKYQEISAVWTENASGYNQANYTKLDNMGNAIIAKIQVSPVGLNTYWEGIGVDSFANNHIAYRTDTSGMDNRLTYTKLDKDGNVLIPNKILDRGAQPSIISDRSQNIHIVYTDPTGPGNRIEYLKLDQNGDILVSPRTISSPTIGNNTNCHMVLDSLQYLHVVWQGDSVGIVSHVMYCKLDTLGNYVIPPMAIVHEPYVQYALEPRIAVDYSNRLHVVWDDTRLGGEDIYYKRGENEQGIYRQCSQAVNSKYLTTTLARAINFPKNMECKIFDITGREVKPHLLAPGIYFIEVDGKISQKVVIVR